MAQTANRNAKRKVKKNITNGGEFTFFSNRYTP